MWGVLLKPLALVTLGELSEEPNHMDARRGSLRRDGKQVPGGVEGRQEPADGQYGGCWEELCAWVWWAWHRARSGIG